MPTHKRNITDVLAALDASSKPKSVLVRVDFNVPMDSNGTITDDSRIRGALPTIGELLGSCDQVILMSHMGRPKLVQKGGTDPETVAQRQALSLEPIAKHLETLIGETVTFVPENTEIPKSAKLALLENLRFTKAEEKNDPSFAETLASHASAYINDAFGTCHRAHASTAGVPAVLEPEFCGIGKLVESELAFLDFSNKTSSDCIAAIIGGSKVSTKLPVIKGLIGSVDILVLGGGLAYTFLKALGIPIGKSLVEDDMVDIAKELMESAQAAGKQLVIPVDAVCAASFPSGPMDIADTKTVDMVVGSTGVPDGWMGLDVGPKSIAKFQTVLSQATKIIFNGPMGVFEIPPFDQGTRGLVDIIASCTQAGCTSVVGGGDSVAALEAFDKTQAVTYVSTGGGATLELLAGDKLPGVEAIGMVEE